MPAASHDYAPRRAGEGALYQIIRDHFETFRMQAASLRDGEGLPAFVEEEFRAFLRCGWLAGGFARFRCTACGLDRLVAFSCKGRGFCPSCGGRRMAERAAPLVDAVLPDVPVRQWVLSLPHRLRYQLAWRHDVCRSVVGILMQAIFRALRVTAVGRGVAGGRSGGVAIVQRFGGALNLNIYVHALVLDGVFAPAAKGGLRFHPVPVTDLDVAEVLATVEARVARVLERRGLSARDDGGDGWEEAPLLGGLAAASVQGRQAIGAGRGRRVRRLGDRWCEVETASSPLGPLQARAQGFDLHAAVRIPAGQRERLASVDQSVDVLRGAGRAGGVAAAGRAAGGNRRSVGHPVRGSGVDRGSAAVGARLPVGGADAANVRVRRACVSTVRRAAAVDRAD